MGWFEDLLSDIGLGDLGINVGGVADLAGPALLSYGITGIISRFYRPTTSDGWVSRRYT